MVIIYGIISKICLKLFVNLHDIVALRVIVVILTIFCCFFSTCTTYAEEKPVVQSKGFTLSPLRSEFNISPGAVEKAFLTVSNSSDEPIKINFEADEFGVINQQYDYTFTEESEVSRWITFAENDIGLKAGETKKISYIVAVPQSAEPGGRYVSLFVGTKSSPSDKGIVSEQRIASLLYITVTGEVSRIGSMMSLALPWYVATDGQWSALLRNEGTTHYRSRYNVTFYSMFGQVVSETRTGEALILPGTIRLVKDDLVMPKWPGLYKVVFVIGLGDTPAEKATRYVLFLPYWSTILLVVLMILVIVTIVRKIRPKE